MRKTPLVIGIAIAIIALGAAVSIYNNNQTPTQTSAVPSQGVSVPFTELAHGAHSTVSARANYLITSSADLLALWGMVDAPGQVPAVDFTQSVVVAVFAGNEPTAGYDIKVSQVRDSDSRVVTVVVTSPGGSCTLPSSVTSPYQIVELPKTTLTLTHQDQESTISCI